jgi:SCY1-like protein 2
MATLAVHEAMGMKVDREAVAMLVLPQLWSMSMGPRKFSLQTSVGALDTEKASTVLSVSQFKRFMDVIKRLGDRVEKEHDQHLRDSQRIEDRSATPVNGIAMIPSAGGVDFESLVSSGNAATVKVDTVIDTTKGWDDDVWGSIFSSAEVSPSSPIIQQRIFTVIH